MKKKILVEGMKCENCAKHVEEALTNVEGVEKVEVNLSEKHVIIDANVDLSDNTIRQAVNNNKYNVVGVETL